jgi:hypothetical protein
MQRITRYSLLLRQILHFTPKDHPHHDATLIALQLSDEFLDHVNTAIKEKQSKIKIAQITSQLDLEIPSEHYVLDLSLPTRSMGTRMCLHEGMVLKNKSGRKLMAYLFNDFLLLAQPKSGPKMFGLYRKVSIINNSL